MLAYDQERQDERTSWWTIATLLLTALAALVALVMVPLDEGAWGIWAVTPLLANVLLSFYVYQTAIGARRRLYMEALESELSTDESGLTIGDTDNVRILAYKRYSWSLTAFGKDQAPEWSARALYSMTTSIPPLMLVCAEFTCVWRLWSAGHTGWAVATGLASLALTSFLAWTHTKLHSQRSGDTSWRLAVIHCQQKSETSIDDAQCDGLVPPD